MTFTTSLRCNTCRYYDGNDNGHGMCRRYVPVVIQVHVDIVTKFPIVKGASDWCGEHEPKS